MKISIGSEIFDGPYGGGNSFLHNLKSELIKLGYEVVHDLGSDDIDIILMTNPLKSSELSTHRLRKGNLKWFHLYQVPKKYLMKSDYILQFFQIDLKNINFHYD